MRCPNANDEQCRYPACGCHSTTQVDKKLMTTRELVAELNNRIKDLYGVEFVPPEYWEDLRQNVKTINVHPISFPSVG